jgi:hypothetical protein
MVLKFERDKTYTFKVTSTGIPELAPKERVPPAVDPAGQRDATQPQKPAQEGREGTPGEGAFAAGVCELECKIKVKDSQGLTTLAVNFDRAGNFPERDVRDLSKEVPRDIPKEIPKPAPPADPGLFGSFEVVVDQGGHVVGSSSGSEPARKTSDAVRSTPAAAAACPPALRCCLELIIGTGLHDQVLEQGKVYEVGSRPSASSLPTPAGSLPGTTERPRGAAATPSQGFEKPAALPSLGFRYDGSGKRAETESEQAKFTVLVNHAGVAPTAGPAAEPGASRATERPSGQQPPAGEKSGAADKPGEPRREGQERGGAFTQERAGEAAYRWQDGMVESLKVTCPSHKGVLGEAPQLTIRRAERELKPERQAE